MRTLYIVSIVFSFVLILIGCSEDEISTQPQADYREAWLGDWSFHIERHTLFWPDTAYFIGSDFEGTISMVDSNLLRVHYKEDSNILVRVDTNGNLSRESGWDADGQIDESEVLLEYRPNGGQNADWDLVTGTR